MGQQGAGETMTSNYPSARPQLHPDTQGAHPSRRDKDLAPLRQTAAGPYGGVPHRESGITVAHSTRSTHTHLDHIHIAYSTRRCVHAGAQKMRGARESYTTA